MQKDNAPVICEMPFARQIDQPCCPFGGIYRVKKNTLKGCKHFNGFNAAFGWQPISFAHIIRIGHHVFAFYDTYTAQFFRRLDSKIENHLFLLRLGCAGPNPEKRDIGIHRAKTGHKPCLSTRRSCRMHHTTNFKVHIIGLRKQFKRTIHISKRTCGV